MIKVAKTAGFCFGVDRAVQLVYKLVESGKKVCTLGEIIHNPQVVSDLQKKGVRIISSPSEANKGETVVIRSHGVTDGVQRELSELGIEYQDATCPFVAKIHRIVSENSNDGAVVLIAGNINHPEIIGIESRCKGRTLVFETEDELENITKSHPEIVENNVIMVAQTTFNKTIWQSCKKFAGNIYTNIKIFDTICNATNERQIEAVKIAKQSDSMVVIGGRHSSNTKKLFSICGGYCKTFLIESPEEITREMIPKGGDIGVTAGASTPAYIIKEVLTTMSEIEKNLEEEQNFAELLEESLNERLYTGKRVKGIVSFINNNEIQVDVGTKQAGFVPLSELSDDPNVKPEDIVKRGDEIDLIVMKVNDQEGTVMLSKKRCDAMAGFEELCKAYEEGTVLDGVVTDVVRGGVLALSNSVKVFIPASHVSDRRVEDLNELLKKQIRFKIIEIKEQRRRAVGSVKAVLKEEKEKLAEAFWNDVEVGKKYTGEVKSLTSFGAFVDLGGVDGLIHITELSWSKIKHPSEVVNVGDMVEVYVKDFDREAKKISLGYKKTEDNPWVKFEKEFAVDQVVNVKIVSLTQFGAFAEIIPGVDGLIHISQISHERVNKVADVLQVGDKVDAKITEIDLDKKRISLSIKALLPEVAPEEKEVAEEVKEELPEGIELSTEE